MLTEDVLTEKKLGCIDLIIIMFNLEKAGVRYKINKDGSLSIYGVDYALVQSSYDRKVWGRIGGVYVEGHFDVVTYDTKLVLECNEYSTRIVPEN
jgi:hypothetical protein